MAKELKTSHRMFPDQRSGLFLELIFVTPEDFSFALFLRLGFSSRDVILSCLTDILASCARIAKAPQLQMEEP
jgi:hypothetical protein